MGWLFRISFQIRLSVATDSNLTALYRRCLKCLSAIHLFANKYQVSNPSERASNLKVKTQCLRLWYTTNFLTYNLHEFKCHLHDGWIFLPAFSFSGTFFNTFLANRWICNTYLKTDGYIALQSNFKHYTDLRLVCIFIFFWFFSCFSILKMKNT